MFSYKFLRLTVLFAVLLLNTFVFGSDDFFDQFDSDGKGNPEV